MTKIQRAQETFKMFISLYPFNPADLTAEIWNWIEGFEGLYQVSNYARVRSVQGDVIRILKPYMNDKGYLTLCLCKGGKIHNVKLHRLVAKCFIPNPDQKPEVHHINGDKLNCCPCNLVWCTRTEHRRLERERVMQSAGVEIPEQIELDSEENLLAAQIFNHEKFGQIRVVMINGEAWIVAADICRALEIQNPRDAISTLEEDEKAAVDITDTSFSGVVQRRKVNVVNEFGMYRLMFKSRKKEAKNFQRWVCHEVLPSIRKHGYYSLDKKSQNKNDFTAREKVKMLDRYIDLATNDDLRDELIRQAAFFICE